MIPIGDDNPTLRFPLMTVILLVSLGAVWFLLQSAGFDPHAVAASVCNLGMVPGEVTHMAALGTSVPIGPGLQCVVDNDPINGWTPLTSMFLHGGWGHLLGNSLFLWVFGNNIEDVMGRMRFLAFYLLCGVAAAIAQIAVDPSSAVPMVGASGAISGVLGAYLLLYPRARVNVLFIFIIFFKVIPLPAFTVLLWWIAWQVIGGLPALSETGIQSGVAFWAHIGGFAAGMLLVRLFVNERLLIRHKRMITSLSGHTR